MKLSISRNWACPAYRERVIRGDWAGILFDRLLQLDGKVVLHYGVVGTVSKVKMDENFSWVSFLSVENLFLRQFQIPFWGIQF